VDFVDTHLGSQMGAQVPEAVSLRRPQ